MIEWYFDTERRFKIFGVQMPAPVVEGLAGVVASDLEKLLSFQNGLSNAASCDKGMSTKVRPQRRFVNNYQRQHSIVMRVNTCGTGSTSTATRRASFRCIVNGSQWTPWWTLEARSL
jgi:hypothetical protein